MYRRWAGYSYDNRTSLISIKRKFITVFSLILVLLICSMKRKDEKTNIDSGITTSFLTHQSFLKRFVTRFFSNKEDIEDVVQETFLRAYVAEQKVEISKHKSFLFTTARNVALTKLNKKSKQVTDFLDDYYESNEFQTEISAEEMVDARQQLVAYCASVQSLDGKCREAFLLKKVHGMTHKEIAKQMSLSLSSIEKYLHKAMLSIDSSMSKRNSDHNSKLNSADGSRLLAQKKGGR